MTLAGLAFLSIVSGMFGILNKNLSSLSGSLSAKVSWVLVGEDAIFMGGFCIAIGIYLFVVILNDIP